MSTELREELKAFEKDLASLVARFLRLYEHLEGTVRPESRPPTTSKPTVTVAATSPTGARPAIGVLLPGYQ